ncbi:MAG: hypothetical protein JO356_02810, partial [Acidobacteria bacterium]|nr:hypothetical protein [Acidobacteriota bacterium]
MIVEIPVIFPSVAAMLAGRFVRNTSNLETRQPGVVVTGSWLTVKEQMALLYARRLAALGYTAFVFDFAGFGESQGEPRQAEIPSRKIEDILAAVNFLSTLSFIEPCGVAYVAICASAQYALHAMARGAKIAAFASVAGWFHNTPTIAPSYDGLEGIGRRMGFAADDVEAYLRSQPRRSAPAYRPNDEHAGMHFELHYYANPTRGAVPEWKNEMAPMSWAHWLTFDGLSPAASITTPTLMVHGPRCALPDNARGVYEQLAGPKRLEWMDGQQIDFYDQPECVEPAVTAIDQWFREQLTVQAPVSASKQVSRNAVNGDVGKWYDIENVIGALAVHVDARR